MSAPKFTPGPWAAEIGGEECTVEARGNPAGTVAIVVGRHSAETHATARLIAASPELYEALAELLRVDDDWHGAVNSEMSAARSKARAALAKAVP